MNSKTEIILIRKWYIPVFILSVSIMLSLDAFYYYSNEVKTIRSQAFNQLKSIAALKVSQISGWNNERFADAKVLSQNPFFEGDFDNLARSKSVDPFKSAVIKNFKLINANSDYSNIILSGTKGNFLLSLDPKLRQIDSSTSRFIKIAVKDKKIIFTDFYKFSLNNEIFLDYIAPVIDKNNFVIAVVILRVNPENFLYPLIKEWPVPSKTSETLIVRREGGNVLYLNDLNHQGGASLKFTIPLTRKEVPAVQAVLGRKGFFEGVGYQGTNVLSYLSPVIGTPWIMVAKIDNSEIYAELYSKEIAAVLFTVLLILCLSGGIVWFYHYRQRNIYLQYSEQQDKLIATKDKFFSIIAHDLKSPFVGLLSLTELMADKTENFSLAEFAEFSKSLNETACNLYKLLENLLEWAMLQNGSINFTPKDFDLSKMISQGINTINQRALQKRITIINKIDNSQKVYADEKMISTVLRNLLSNAVKFTHQNGMVTISAKEIEDQMIEIFIKDSGIGMPKSIVEKLFELGEKTGRQGTDGELSTGLGLLLCKEFVEKNGGKILVESEEGVGSAFYFTLPKFN
jgi:signal transduction histidine kinase